MKITIIDFSGGSDGITAMYIDGSLYKHGDYYHDKINDVINGFIEGLRFCEKFFELEGKDLEEDDPWVYYTWDLAGDPPQKLDDVFNTLPPVLKDDI